MDCSCGVVRVGAAATAQQPPPLPPPGQTLTPDQLDDLVAPIALYPDELLSQIMVAATYPLEVVEAFQWQQRNPGLDRSRVDAGGAADRTGIPAFRLWWCFRM